MRYISHSLSALWINVIIIIMSFTAKIDSEKLNDDEIDDRMLADRLYSCNSRVAAWEVHRNK